MARPDICIGAPVWGREWCLDEWFDCVLENVAPEITALVFCVPGSDDGSREVIRRRGEPFLAVEVVRDPGPQLNRLERREKAHTTLANARNRVLRRVNELGPRWFVSWDTDFFVPPGTVDELVGTIERGRARLPMWWPVAGVFAWMNRQEPRQTRYKGKDMLWQPPPSTTVMELTERGPVHISTEDWERHQLPLVPVDMVLGFQVMHRRAWQRCNYGPHPADEHVPFFRQLRAQGMLACLRGDIRGVHLYDQLAEDDINLGWPWLMDLAEQQPLAVRYRGKVPPELEALGYYPKEKDGSNNQRVAA